MTFEFFNLFEMAALQSLASLITLLALTLTITAVVMPRWERNDPYDTINDNNRKVNNNSYI